MLTSKLARTGVVCGLCMILWVSSLRAQTSDLTFEPTRPERSQHVVATYHPEGENESHLLLRARLRTATDGRDNERVGSLVVAVLQRQADGRYVGQFDLPSDVVYATFAVEDRLGTRVDSHEGRFWDLMVHGPEGHPVLEGLEQRFNDLLDRDDRPLLDLARTMVDLYPERVEGWNALRAAEGLLGEEGAAARRERHQERARYFDRLLAETPSPDPDQLGLLFSYASLTGEQEIADRWRERLVAEQPGHFFALVDPVLTLRRARSTDQAALVRGLDSLWVRASDRRARELIVRTAFPVAISTDNIATIRLWTDRYAVLDPHDRPSIARALAGNVATREEGIEWLRQEIDGLEPPPDVQRPIGATRATFERDLARRRAALQTNLARALIAAGQTAEAVQILDQATATDWRTDRLQILGEARLSAGDSLGAMRAFALVASDPGTAGPVADSLFRRTGVSSAAWEDALSRAGTEMVHRTMMEASGDPMPSVDLSDGHGARTPLASLLGENATVLVFWSSYCSFSHRAMPDITALATQLRNERVPVLAVTHDSPLEAERYLRDNGWDLHVRYDEGREVARAVGNWATPQYFVLDGSGRIRFAFTSLADIPRQVLALQVTGPSR